MVWGDDYFFNYKSLIGICKTDYKMNIKSDRAANAILPATM